MNMIRLFSNQIRLHNEEDMNAEYFNMIRKLVDDVAACKSMLAKLTLNKQREGVYLKPNELYPHVMFNLVTEGRIPDMVKLSAVRDLANKHPRVLVGEDGDSVLNEKAFDLVSGYIYIYSAVLMHRVTFMHMYFSFGRILAHKFLY